jgi:hypothetical protein
MLGSFKPLKKISYDGKIVKKETITTEKGQKINITTVQTKGNFKPSR